MSNEAVDDIGHESRGGDVLDGGGRGQAPPINGSLGIALLFRELLHNMAARRGEDKRPQGDARLPAAAAPARSAGAGVAFDVGEIDDPRLVPAGGDKAQQIRGRHRRGAVVDERMIVERVVRQHVAVEHHRHATRGVVDQRERGDAARPHAQQRVKLVGAAEGKPRRGEPGGELAFRSIRRSSSMTASQKPALVLEEEALAMPARQRAAQRRRLGDGEDRRVGMRSGGRCRARRAAGTGLRASGVRRRTSRDDAGAHPPASRACAPTLQTGVGPAIMRAGRPARDDGRRSAGVAQG